MIEQLKAAAERVAAWPRPMMGFWSMRDEGMQLTAHCGIGMALEHNQIVSWRDLTAVTEVDLLKLTEAQCWRKLMGATVYFAHPKSDYYKPREARSLELLERFWPGGVVNPNHERHTEAYRKWGFEYFDRLARKYDAVAFQRFPGGQLGAGVAREVDAAYYEGRRVFEIVDQGPPDHAGWTRVMLVPRSRPPAERLTVEETRKLIWELESQAFTR